VFWGYLIVYALDAASVLESKSAFRRPNGAMAYKTVGAKGPGGRG